MDEDFLLALKLQEQYNYEASTALCNENITYDQVSKKRKIDIKHTVVPVPSSFGPEKPMSIVDESWEMLDPSPDVRAMFLGFNDKFFWGRLGGVEVKWSSRMTLCAGICSYEGRGGLCSIRLSEPLLKLRPRRDLVQTLLHEMIHAYLFITQNNRDRDGHGPEFCKHMNRINNASGTKITVYHTFHDEVDLYRQHWWRCNGPCQNRKPFFGYVKRAMNRPPSAIDPWWPDHQRSCGGTYIKIKEPENYGKKAKTEDNKDKKVLTQPMKKNKLSSTVTGVQDIRKILPFSGRGFVLGGSSLLTSPKKSHECKDALPLDFTGHLKTSSSTALTKDANLPSQNTASKTTGQTLVSLSSGKLQNLPTRSISSGKKSVSNTQAFININGSPVKIYRTANSSTKPPHNQLGFSKTTQKSVADLFHTKEMKTSPKPGLCTSVLPSESIGPSNDHRNGSIFAGTLSSKSFTPAVSSGTPASDRQASVFASSTLGSSKPSSVGSPNSKHLKSPRKSGLTVPVSRKRPLDSQVSTHIFEFFQRTSTTSGLKQAKEEPPSRSLTPIIQPASVTSGSLTVSCPVCQTTMLESEINNHLDSCLT